MIPSKKLRRLISKKNKIQLEDFSWEKELEKKVFKILFEDMTLKDIFENGYNIGNCLLTSYYIFPIFNNASICSGKVAILKGTKNSINGDHVWIENDEYIIDTTLMIKIPLNFIYSKYYKKEYTISPTFSSADLNYDTEIYEKTTNPFKYYFDLFNIDKKP